MADDAAVGVARHRAETLRAVYEDRGRIATDLHDRVIQRVFAAGLQLQSLASDLPEDLRPRMLEAMSELDGTIKALRDAIFALTRPSVAIDTGAALDDLAARATRMLGFTPSVAVHGGATVSRELHDDLVSVAQEGLSNVLRHAEAASASLDLYVEEGVVRLELADDGKGMPSDVANTSGTGNIRRRAEQRGGSASWEPVEPHGTRLVWQVPRV